MPRVIRSPILSTKRPETNPDEKRAKAKAEIISPMAVLFTPKVEANNGIAGMMKP